MYLLGNTLWGYVMIRKLTIYTDKIKKGKKMLVYSDLHLGFKKGNDLNQILEIQELKPENYDCILIPGDIVHFATVVKDDYKLKEMLTTLKKLTGSTPVYYVLGNHDQYKRLHFEGWEAESSLKLCKELYELGNFIQLENGIVNFDGEVELKGFNISSDYYLNKHESDEAFLQEYQEFRNSSKFSKQHFSIFMLHDSKAFYRLSQNSGSVIESNTDLVLSGHMHAGLTPNFCQGFLDGRGIISPDFKVCPEYAYGVRECNHSLFYINGAVNPFIENTFLNRLYGFNCTILNLEPKENCKKLIYEYK